MSYCAGKYHPVCAALPDVLRCRLCREARLLDLEAGEAVLVKDVSNEVILLRKGYAIGGSSRDGGKKGIAITMNRPGDIANIVRLQMYRRPRDPRWNAHHWGFAVTDCIGCAVPAILIDELIEESHALSMAVLANALEKYSEALEIGTSVNGLTGVERIEWLDGYLRKLGGDLFDLTQERIGLIVGMNRVSVARAMKTYTEKLR